MNQIEKIKAEIERRIKVYNESNHGISIRSEECKEILSFIESIEMEQDKDLVKEIENYQKQILVGENESYTKSAVAAMLDYLARHFYSLGKESSNKACPKIKGWVAREPKFNLMLFTAKPERLRYMWDVMEGEEMPINPSLFPDLRWEDEPIEVELTIKNI